MLLTPPYFPQTLLLATWSIKVQWTPKALDHNPIFLMEQRRGAYFCAAHHWRGSLHVQGIPAGAGVGRAGKRPHRWWLKCKFIDCQLQREMCWGMGLCWCMNVCIVFCVGFLLAKCQLILRLITSPVWHHVFIAAFVIFWWWSGEWSVLCCLIWWLLSTARW